LLVETEVITFNSFSGRSKSDYLQIINDRGKSGWRFLKFVPRGYNPKGVKGVELLFEKEIVNEDLSSLDKILP